MTTTTSRPAHALVAALVAEAAAPTVVCDTDAAPWRAALGPLVEAAGTGRTPAPHEAALAEVAEGVAGLAAVVLDAAPAAGGPARLLEDIALVQASSHPRLVVVAGADHLCRPTSATDLTLLEVLDALRAGPYGASVVVVDDHVVSVPRLLRARLHELVAAQPAPAPTTGADARESAALAGRIPAQTGSSGATPAFPLPFPWRSVSSTPPVSPSSVGTRNGANRDEWVSRALAQVPPGARLLDVGAGEGRYRGLCSHLDYTSQDFSQYDGTGNAEGLQTGTWDVSAIDIVSDIVDMPLPDRSFDVVLCTEVLEHVPDPVSAVREMVRVLRPGGLMLLTAPIASLTHFAPHYYSNGFSRYFYEKVLGDSGCDVLELTYNGNYFEAVAQELRRVEDLVGVHTAAPATHHPDLAAAYGILLERLAQLSADGTRSSELSAHGLHVVAQRRTLA